MPKSTHRPFEFEGIRLLSSALHAQLMERRRSTLEHDLKNALHGLVSGTELLSKALTATSPRITPAECLSLLQQQITRAQHDLNRMLDEIAPAVLETIEFDLQELLVECRHDLRHDLQNVELTTDLGPRLRIRGCRPRLKDALLYLLFGAMDTMRPATAIELTTRAYGDTATIELRYRPADGQCPPPAKLGEIYCVRVRRRQRACSPECTAGLITFQFRRTPADRRCEPRRGRQPGDARAARRLRRTGGLRSRFRLTPCAHAAADRHSHRCRRLDRFRHAGVARSRTRGEPADHRNEPRRTRLRPICGCSIAQTARPSRAPQRTWHLTSNGTCGVTSELLAPGGAPP
jgi:hypothetical protein